MAGSAETAMRALAPGAGPASVTELTEGERFALHAFRRWVHGAIADTGLHGRLLWQALAEQLGEEDAREALTALSNLIRTIQGYARRRFAYHQPCCGAITLDEVAVLRLLGACQHRNLLLARGHALWLVHADGTGDLLDAACALAARMHRHDLTLHHGIPEAPSNSVMGGGGTLRTLAAPAKRLGRPTDLRPS